MSEAQVISAPDATTAAGPGLWTVLPGWGISADLTPPEILNKRQLGVLAKMIAAGVVVLLLLCAGAYALAVHANSRASADLVAEQDHTLALQKVAGSYSGVVSIQGSASRVQADVAQVMGGDVDLVKLMVVLQSSLPKSMTIKQETITISTVGVVGNATAPGGLDKSGLPRIGTITLSGTGKSIDDLSDYVDSLAAVPGLVDVLPVSNTRAETGKTGTEFNISIGLTNQLLSHRFDVSGG